jgi:hypothetical protein
MSVTPYANDRAWMLKQVQHDECVGHGRASAQAVSKTAISEHRSAGIRALQAGTS